MIANRAAQRFSDPVRATPPGAGSSRPSRRYGRGRTCEASACTTQLSVYNPRTRCWVHDEARPYMPRIRPKAEDGPAVIAAADLRALAAPGGSRQHPEPPAEPQPEPFPQPGPVPPAGRSS